MKKKYMFLAVFSENVCILILIAVGSIIYPDTA